jgi:hypothetical protein
MHEKKSVFYIIDALIFSALILGGIFLLAPISPDPGLPQPTSSVAQDLIGVIENMRLDEINATWVQEQFTDKNITNTSTTVLQQLGEFWAMGEMGLAHALLTQTFAGVNTHHLDFGIWINDELIYTAATTPQTHIASGWRVVSGIEKGKPIKGFVARAQAQHVSGNTTRVISISPEGAAWDDGSVEITKWFDLRNMTINDARLVLSVHADQQNNDVTVDINDGTCYFLRNAFSWEFSNSEGNVGTRDVANCLIDDINKMTIHLNNDGYNGHTHPGMYLQINYTSDALGIQEVVDVSKRFYFDNIRSIESGNDGAGVWASYPFYIPESATDINVSMQIVAHNVRDFGGNDWFWAWDDSWKRRRNYDYTLFVNGEDPIDVDASPDENPIYTYDAMDLSSHLVVGTNIVSLYFNNYGDYVWGDDWVELYSDPYGDPEGSSYIEVNYSIQEDSPYGLLEIATVQPFVSSSDHDMTETFTFPDEAVAMGDIYIHTVQRYSDRITMWADPFSPPGTEVFRSPSSRAVPTTTFVDAEHFSLSPALTNAIRVRDDGSGNEVIGGLSGIEHHFYVPSFVGYADVFATEQEALDDAEARLQEAVGTYLLLEDVETQSNTITKVPSLWGPAIMEVRVWD